MVLIISIAASGALLIALALIFLLWRLSHTNVSVDDAADVCEFSWQSRRQMERLLDPEDFRFARAMGCSAQRVRQLRRERRRIFGLFLLEAVREFNRTHRELRLLVAISATDRPDLAAALIRQRLAFYRTVMEAQIRLKLDRLGLETVSSVDVLGPLYVLRDQLGQLAPAEMAAA